MKRNNSHFGRLTPTYTCRVCSRRTRETGDGESSCELCAYCYHEAGLENSYNDGYVDAAQFNAELAALKTRFAGRVPETAMEPFQDKPGPVKMYDGAEDLTPEQLAQAVRGHPGDCQCSACALIRDSREAFMGV